MSKCGCVAELVCKAPVWTFVLATALLAPVMSEAQEVPSHDVLNAVRLSEDVSERPQIDGRVDELFWERVPAITDFLQQNPIESDPATEMTEVRVVYDDEALYVSVRAFHSRPDQVVSRIMQRDRILEVDPFGRGELQQAGDDVFAILLDPFHDHRLSLIHI